MRHAHRVSIEEPLDEDRRTTGVIDVDAAEAEVRQIGAGNGDAFDLACVISAGQYVDRSGIAGPVDALPCEVPALTLAGEGIGVGNAAQVAGETGDCGADVVGELIVECRQQPLKIDHIERCCFNGALADLQCPVPTQAGRASQVIGGRDISSSGHGQAVDERPPFPVGAHLATVEQDVALAVQGLADGIEQVAAAGKVAAVQPVVAQLDLADIAMAEDVDGVDAAATVEVVGDLLQAVLVRLQHHHFGAGFEAVDELPIVLYLAVDEHHLLAMVRRAGRGRGQGIAAGGSALGGGLAVGGIGCRLGSGRLDGRGGDRAVEHHPGFERYGKRAPGRRVRRFFRGSPVPPHGALPPAFNTGKAGNGFPHSLLRVRFARGDPGSVA
ncbi:hypothetical protein D9M68_537420 [compost metagenome]